MGWLGVGPGPITVCRLGSKTESFGRFPILAGSMDSWQGPNAFLSRVTRAPLGVFRFYSDGLRSMTLGRRLWIIIAVKMLVIFGILKLFFFPDFLQTRFDNDNERSDYVLEQITTRPGNQSSDTEVVAHD